MAINFDSIISNAKGTANIAKLKVTLGFKTNELNKLYTELGKLFYDFTKNNQTEEVESVSEDNHSSENETTNHQLLIIWLMKIYALAMKKYLVWNRK